MSENVTNTAATAFDQATALTIEIAAHAGTCYGVQRALDMALAAAPQAGECTQVHTLGPLIHNPIVVRELAEAGVDSLKIEGRMKSVHYVATVVSVYRKAIDDWYSNPGQFSIKSEWKDELEKVSHRPYFYGFAVNKPDENGQISANAKRGTNCTNKK